MKEKWSSTAYIAGPYRDDILYEEIKNIRKAEEIALLLWSYGWVSLCPHKNAALFEGAYGLGHEVFLKGDLALLKQCDIIVVIPGWRNSSGTIEEIKLADKLEKPIYYWESEIDRWCLANYYKELE